MIWIYPSKDLKSIYTRHSHFETSLTKKIIRCLSTTPKATFFIYIYLHIAIHSIDSPKTGRRNAQNANSYYTYRPNWVHGDPMTLWTQSTQNNLFERTSISLVFSKLTGLKRISFTFFRELKHLNPNQGSNKHDTPRIQSPDLLPKKSVA